MGVAAVVRDDLAERRRRAEALEVVVQTIARVKQRRQVGRVAVARVEDRCEPRQRVVLGDVLVGRVRAARVGILGAGAAVAGHRRRADGRVGRAAVLGARVVRRSGRVGIPEILRVDLPADAVGVELVEQRRHARWIHAAVAAVRRVRAGGRVELAVVRVRGERPRGVDRALQRVICRAVALIVGHRRLAAGQREVVVEARVAGAVVVLQERALGRKRLPQVGVAVQAGEARVVRLVLEHDQPDVLDRAAVDAEAVVARRLVAGGRRRRVGVSGGRRRGGRRRAGVGDRADADGERAADPGDAGQAEREPAPESWAGRASRGLTATEEAPHSKRSFRDQGQVRTPVSLFNGGRLVSER